MKICIDAGHGGHDSGACNGQYYEKTYALAIALKLGKLLSKYHEVIYTRRIDKFVELNDRCSIANKENCDLFISIHLNSAASEKAEGIETLCYSLESKSGLVAKLVQNKLVYSTEAIDRGLKARTNLAVLRGTKMPAILIETGFISNKKELKKLITPEYQDKIAQAICEGVNEYFGIKTEKLYQSPQEIVDSLVERGIITNRLLWYAKCVVGSHSYWLANKIANMTDNVFRETKLETVNDIVWELQYRGIMTDAKLWLELLNNDTDLYWLAYKGANMTQNKG